ncbi:MAG: OmpA family protein [Raineya sp.]|nr:OmpA family protein [Raineya sp.]MDW8297416.1 OmpA family protein [Raineya sp.]
MRILFILMFLSLVFSTCQKPPLKTATNGEISDCGGLDDGRFTIGANGIRLMYGFPIPASTSHFVVKVGDKFASNYGRLPGVKKICTKKKFKVVGNRKFSEMEFKFEGITITQRLIPVDDSLKETDSLSPARYYLIEYEFENNKVEPREVAFQLLIDNMIADNDAPKLDGDGTMVDVETKYVGNQVPKQVFLYRKARDLSDHTAEILTAKEKAVKPDELAIGRWPYFHKIVWDYTPCNCPYTDAAVIMRWNLQTLASGQKRRVGVYYGMARKTGKSPSQDVVHLQTAFSENISMRLFADTAYFDNASAVLSKDFTNRIDQILQGRDVRKVIGVLVEGHTDAKGTDEANVEYSRKRAKSVMDYLAKKGIPHEKVVPKGYGEMYALQTTEAETNGNPKDRKAVIIMYLAE